VGSEPTHSSEFIQSLVWTNGTNRPISCALPVGQAADSVSDLDRLSSGTLRGNRRQAAQMVLADLSSSWTTDESAAVPASTC
jgi:hypothetical protein